MLACRRAGHVLPVGCLVALVACGGSGSDSAALRTPEAFEILGVYDFATQSGSRAIAVVTSSAGGLSIRIEFGPEAYISGGFGLGSDGTVSFSGIDVTQDIGNQTRPSGGGVAVVDEMEQFVRITGTLEGTVFAVDGTEFTMSRPLSGTPTGRAGCYRFTLFGISGRDIVSTVHLRIDVAADGSGGTIGTANEVRPDGSVLGMFFEGGCLFSPAGQMRCTLPYSRTGPPPPDAFGLASFNASFDGTLVASGGGGQIVGDTPPINHAFPVGGFDAAATPDADCDIRIGA